MTHIPRIFATQFMFVYLSHGVMPLESDKRIRVDKIRKTPLESADSSGVFRTIFIFAQLLSGGHQTCKSPTTHSELRPETWTH